MSPAVPNLRSMEVQSYDDGQLRWIIENGIRPSGMPASRGILSDQEIWTLVVYLRHLPPAGSLGEPRVYSEEEYGK
jgi:mono/diheme cytochrome c family protein